MLTFDEKLSIIESFPELQRRDVSLGRINFHYEESVFDKKTVVYHLHPNGNGFVYAGMLPGWDKDAKGMVNIRELAEKELKQLIADSIYSLSDKTGSHPHEEALAGDSQKEHWVNANRHTLLLVQEEGTWTIYNGLHLEDAFETYDEARQYLLDEGFNQTRNPSENGR